MPAFRDIAMVRKDGVFQSFPASAARLCAASAISQMDFSVNVITINGLLHGVGAWSRGSTSHWPAKTDLYTDRAYRIGCRAKSREQPHVGRALSGVIVSSTQFPLPYGLLRTEATDAVQGHPNGSCAPRRLCRESVALGSGETEPRSGDRPIPETVWAVGRGVRPVEHPCQVYRTAALSVSGVCRPVVTGVPYL